MTGPSSQKPIGNNSQETQPFTFTPNEEGNWTIAAKVGPTTTLRTVDVGTDCDTPTVENQISDITISTPRPDTAINLRDVFDDFQDSDDALTYSISADTFDDGDTDWENVPVINSTDYLILDYLDGTSGEGTGTITIRATDTGALWIEDAFDVTVSAAGGNTQPTVTLVIPNDSTARNTDYVILDISPYFGDSEDTDAEMTYSGTSVIISGDSDTIDAITSVGGSTAVTVDVKNGRDGTADITIRATDTGGLWIEDTFRLVVGSG